MNFNDMEPPMGVRSSDIMALMAILAGAGAGYGLTNLYAHSRQAAPAVAEPVAVVETEAPRVDVEVESVRVEVEPIRVRVGAGHIVVVTTAPHMVTRLRMHRPDRLMVMEIRREARAEPRHRAQGARERVREVRRDVLFGEALEVQEALSSLASLEALETLESLKALESLDNLENVVNLEALEQALEELEQELDGVVTIAVEELSDADDQHKKKRRKKRRIIVKLPGEGGSGG